MMTEKTEQLSQTLEPITDPAVRKQVLGVLWTRVAAGIEKKEEGWEKTGHTSTGPAWVETDKYLSTLAKENPDKALDLALELVLRPQSVKPEQKKVDEWLAVSGLTILGFEEIKSKLDDYLSTGKYRDALQNTIVNGMQNDVSNFTTKHAFSDPKGITTIQSIYIGLGTKEAKSDLARSLFRMAELRKNAPDVKVAANILIAEDGCDYLAERF